MNDAIALLKCPVCGGPIDTGLACAGCKREWPAPDGIPSFRLDANRATDIVRRFYDTVPFPGYPPNDSINWLRSRADRSPFARLLDAAICDDALIAEIGCGTGQMSIYLARADRVVVGLDLSRRALELGASAARRYGTSNVFFVEGDINKLPLRDGVFDVVYSSGVLHHMPDPRAAFHRIVRAVKPGGIIIVGLYNRFARLPLRLRRLVAKLTGYRWIPFDPVLSDRNAEPARREAWLRDQYRHPKEHRHSVAQVRRWFAEAGVDYCSTYPSTLLSTDTEDLFARAEDEWPLETLLSQLGWMRSIGGEGGLFVTIGRRWAS